MNYIHLIILIAALTSNTQSKNQLHPTSLIIDNKIGEIESLGGDFYKDLEQVFTLENQAIDIVNSCGRFIYIRFRKNCNSNQTKQLLEIASKLAQLLNTHIDKYQLYIESEGSLDIVKIFDQRLESAAIYKRDLYIRDFLSDGRFILQDLSGQDWNDYGGDLLQFENRSDYIAINNLIYYSIMSRVISGNRSENYERTRIQQLIVKLQNNQVEHTENFRETFINTFDTAVDEQEYFGQFLPPAAYFDRERELNLSVSIRGVAITWLNYSFDEDQITERLFQKIKDEEITSLPDNFNFAKITVGYDDNFKSTNDRYKEDLHKTCLTEYCLTQVPNLAVGASKFVTQNTIVNKRSKDFEIIQPKWNRFINSHITFNQAKLFKNRTL